MLRLASLTARRSWLRTRMPNPSLARWSQETPTLRTIKTNSGQGGNNAIPQSRPSNHFEVHDVIGCSVVDGKIHCWARRCRSGFRSSAEPCAWKCRSGAAPGGQRADRARPCRHSGKRQGHRLRGGVWALYYFGQRILDCVDDQGNYWRCLHATGRTGQAAARRAYGQAASSTRSAQGSRRVRCEWRAEAPAGQASDHAASPSYSHSRLRLQHLERADDAV